MARLAFVRLLAPLAALAAASATDDPICYWTKIRGAVVRDTLYLDGGSRTTTTTDDHGTHSYPDPGNGSMYALNFSRKFEVSTNTLLALFDPINEGASSAQVADYFDGFMFADAYEMYTYGGLPNSDVVSFPAANYFSGYEFFEKDTTVQDPELGADPALSLQNVTRYITNGAGVNVPSENMGFYFGGFQNSSEEQYSFDLLAAVEPADSLISINMATERQPLWFNTSLSGSNPDVEARADGGLVWIPVSTKGILIAIGGVPYPEELFSNALDAVQATNNRNKGSEFMQNLPVYDVANSVWYVQAISGTDHPPALAQFCSVVVSQNSSSQRSYEIYIYGGYNGGGNGTLEPPSDDVWVLSVPSFTWTKAHSGNSTAGRYGHFCASPYPDQMLVIGGQSFEQNCIIGNFTQVFNLNKLQWETAYDPTVYNADGYKIPSVVANTIAKQTTATWSDPAIGSLFANPYPSPIATYWPYTPPSHHSSNIAAIAGGAVVGVVCLIVLILAILWYRRKHKKSPQEGNSDVQPYEQVSRWRRGVAKTDPSVTTTEVDDGSAINPHTGGYYKPAEVAGDEGFHQHSPASPRPGGFAEAGGGTRRISAGQTISPRSPRSPQSGALGAQEADGEERYEMEVMESQRGSGDSGARDRFRDHPFYPLSMSDGDGRSQASGPASSGPSYSQSQASHTDAIRGVPSPYLVARPGNGAQNDAELPASPVRPTHMRNISSISGGGFPQVSPPLEHVNMNPTATPTHPEDDLDALEAFHTGSPQPRQSSSYRPSHTRNLSSLSSGINQLPTPTEELSDEEIHRQSTLIAKLPSPLEGTTPIAEERDPLMGNETSTGAVKVGDDVYSPSSYSRESTLMSGGRSPASRKPVGGIEQRAGFSGHEPVPGEDRQTL